ncbi:MAG: alpha/beta fold hydrolase [Clostridiales bacterium]|nr:alpha/beta fold hydrolase [Clostridiales bacterium]
MKKKHLKLKITLIAVVVVMFIYALIGNIIVSAALVPDFMRKLDDFERVTEKSYSEMVQTDEITENTKAAREEATAFLKKADGFKVKTESADGYELIASVFKQAKPKGKPWVTLLHGYTGWKEEMYHYAARYYDLGFNVLCPDLRCQGESDGDFIGMGWTDREDVLLWIDKILESYPKAKIVLHGESMGASCALMMTGTDIPKNVKYVISDCAMEDSTAMFKKQLKDWFGLPDLGFIGSARLWLKLRGGYDLKDAAAINEVGKSSIPTLFIHGDKDKIVPVDAASELYEACGASEKELMIVEGAGHAQSCYKDPEAYYDKIFSFIEAVIPKETQDEAKDKAETQETEETKAESTVNQSFDLTDIPKYTGTAFVYINDNKPEFKKKDIWKRPQESLSQLDELGRCGVALSCIGRETMPEEDRDFRIDFKPTGWAYGRYDFIEGENLYNRCHLIGYQLSGNEAVERNLFTGTRYLNIEGMLPFENAIASYVRMTGNHVMYRVEPIFKGDEFLARGVHLMARSVEDKGRGLAFNVFCYNAQPGVKIDYSDGSNSLSKNTKLLKKYQKGLLDTEIETASMADVDPGKMTYVLNTVSKKFHYEGCKNAIEMSSDKKKIVTSTREKLIGDGYEPCGWCKP